MEILAGCRRRREGITEDVKTDAWMQRSKDTLEGTSERRKENQEKETDESGADESEKEEEVIIIAIRKLTKKKAAGEDEIMNEARISGNAQIIKLEKL